MREEQEQTAENLRCDQQDLEEWVRSGEGGESNQQRQNVSQEEETGQVSRDNATLPPPPSADSFSGFLKVVGTQRGQLL